MKRNIIVILTLALVCVLFVACGKEEAPVDVAIGELQAARENIDNQIAALEAQRPATKSGGTTAVHLAAAGQPTPTPVEKTRDQMTEKEKEAYDRAKIAEFAERAKNDPSIDVGATAESGVIPNMGYYEKKFDPVPIYIPGLEDFYNSIGSETSFGAEMSLDTFTRAANIEYLMNAIQASDSRFLEYESELEEYLVSHPEVIVPFVKSLPFDVEDRAPYFDEVHDAFDSLFLAVTTAA